MNHRTDIDYEGGLKQLSRDLADLRYDALAEFLRELSNCIRADGADDLARHRPQLASALYDAQADVAQAWRICRRYMPLDNGGEKR